MQQQLKNGIIQSLKNLQNGKVLHKKGKSYRIGTMDNTKKLEIWK